ncbi:SDR family oxidoreductase [Panacibacter ginsenosidivorans]|uniref:SDR family oxidoreductase n=1 Tax=Panacibacter ginsenosidivorans TaxID=1813871 RepID=A0A5B8VBJ0_9BACT|nr:SDR family oxidoreductase [Panacibacter ginsenosidivorans]QEC68877.1 SDR family oxidoreductase [Panacibacter ginsenosidivorans]
MQSALLFNKNKPEIEPILTPPKKYHPEFYFTFICFRIKMLMKIFVTGATGYIGNNLAKRLAGEGHIIHALNRSAQKSTLLNHDNIQLFKGDITDPASVKNAMQGCEQVYHLAAYARVWAKDPSTYHTLNVEGTRHVLEAARELAINDIVVTSTAGVLGPSGERPVKEDDPRIGEMLNEYEETKTQSEEMCRDYSRRFGMRIVMVNPPRIYGPGVDSESNALTRMVHLYMQGKWRILPGDGKRTGSYVHIDDVVNGHVLAMQKGRAGERYILSGENVSYTTFFNTLAKVNGKKNFLLPLPVWVMVLAGYGMMGLTKITGKPPLLTPKWIRKYLYDWSLSCEKAQRELGYTYRSLEEGLQQTVDWLKFELKKQE